MKRSRRSASMRPSAVGMTSARSRSASSRRAATASARASGPRVTSGTDSGNAAASPLAPTTAATRAAAARRATAAAGAAASKSTTSPSSPTAWPSAASPSARSASAGAPSAAVTIAIRIGAAERNGPLTDSVTAWRPGRWTRPSRLPPSRAGASCWSGGWRPWPASPASSSATACSCCWASFLEYLARILAEVRSRPLYTLDKAQALVVTPTETARAPVAVPPRTAPASPLDRAADGHPEARRDPGSTGRRGRRTAGVGLVRAKRPG